MRSYAASMILLVLVCIGAGCANTRSVHGSVAAASIVVKRPENNGSVNILPCTIFFSSGQRITLSGGEAGAVSVSAGSLWVQASSVDPYHPETADLTAWRSPRMEIRLQPGEVMRLSVEPRSKGSTYVGGWSIERAANEKAFSGRADYISLSYRASLAARP